MCDLKIPYKKLISKNINFIERQIKKYFRVYNASQINNNKWARLKYFI